MKMMRSALGKLSWQAPLSPSQQLFVIVRCQKNDASHESDSFRNNLRKGFAPVKREKIQQQKGKGKPKYPEASSSSRKLGNNVLIGADDFSMEKWREVDKKMNKYPGKRTFSAIGSGGNDFKAAMIKAVENEIGPVHPECVADRPSSQGAYVSVRITVTVNTPDQVVAIYANMKGDNRLKWFM